ncbi:MAG: hypothetical protein Q8R30_02585 [bacterium]|nr:hypothetical protein [bacterium]MDZ4285401.1 hypothetical protein [Candidatus Sungbacteria bacterium]
MDPNTWYFALSALAQVIGGVLGLNAIFVAVRLEHIIKQVDYYKRRGASMLKWEKKSELGDNRISFDGRYILKKLRALERKHRDDPAFITHLEHTLKRYDPTLRVTPERAMRFMDDTIYSLEDNLEQKKNVIHSMIVPSVISLFTIFGSMMMLGFSDYFFKLFSASLEALIGIIVIGILGMYLIAVSSYRILWSIE